MTFQPCALIPTYDNPATLESVVSNVLARGLPVVIVDDGSSDDGKRAAQRAAQHPQVTLHRRPHNGGKGAAVKTGFLVAAHAGYTHALQVDADGQHDLEDVERFIEAARTAPDTLILGHPVFDATVPRSRLVGRQITIFWTTVETLSRRIVDPMCGFRVYPLEAVLRTTVHGDRMDFDPEIAVRLVWAGTPVANLPTRVRYLSAEEGGVSHFRLLHDNVRISLMHTRLVLEGILRVFLWPLRSLRRRPRLLGSPRQHHSLEAPAPPPPPARPER